jgi:hypothetical protein
MLATIIDITVAENCETVRARTLALRLGANVLVIYDRVFNDEEPSSLRDKAGAQGGGSLPMFAGWPLLYDAAEFLSHMVHEFGVSR